MIIVNDSKLSFAVLGTGAVVAGFTGWFFGRRLLFYSRIATSLKGKINQFDPETVKAGDYLFLEGTVKKVDDQVFIAPKSHESCVEYQVIQLRVVEELKEKSVGVRIGLGSMLSIFGKKKAVGGSSLGLKQRYRTRNQVEEEISQNRKSIGWVLSVRLPGEVNSTEFVINMKEFEEFSSDLSQLKVTSLKDLLNLKVSHDEFVPNKSTSTANSFFHTLGYRTIEKVLKEGDELIVLGEVLLCTTNPNGSKRFVISRPLSKSIFDLRSARLKPFLVSKMDRMSLIRKIEKIALWEVAKATFPFMTGISVFCFGFSRCFRIK